MTNPSPHLIKSTICMNQQVALRLWRSWRSNIQWKIIKKLHMLVSRKLKKKWRNSSNLTKKKAPYMCTMSLELHKEHSFDLVAVSITCPDLNSDLHHPTAKPKWLNEWKHERNIKTLYHWHQQGNITKWKLIYDNNNTNRKFHINSKTILKSLKNMFNQNMKSKNKTLPAGRGTFDKWGGKNSWVQLRSLLSLWYPNSCSYNQNQNLNKKLVSMLCEWLNTHVHI